MGSRLTCCNFLDNFLTSFYINHIFCSKFVYALYLKLSTVGYLSLWNPCMDYRVTLTSDGLFPLSKGPSSNIYVCKSHILHHQSPKLLFHSEKIVTISSLMHLSNFLMLRIAPLWFVRKKYAVSKILEILNRNLAKSFV